MSDEMVAWVDENEQLIKVITKDLANSAHKYLHIEVVVVIVDDKGRALLQQRSKKKPVAPGMWTVAAAGHVTYGDTVETTAHRELEEEMGIKVPKLVLLFREKAQLEHETHFAYWFIGRYQGDEIKIQNSEVDGFAWVAKSDFANFSSNNKVSPRSTSVLSRLWAGVWEKELKLI